MKNLYNIIVLVAILFTQQSLNSQQNILSKIHEIATIEQKVMMPMRDGVRLSTDIYVPKTDKKVPIIFSRTPYNFNSWGDGEEKTRTHERAYEALKRGYAYVVQNERGRYFSEGKWDILGIPLTDGYDAFSWMSKQPWSNGKIGTLGCSSTAEWQMAVAALDHPSHAAMVPQGFGAGVGRVGEFFEQGNWYRGGVEQLLFATWLYGVEHDEFKPRIPAGATQEDLLRISRFYDLAPENPKVDWSVKLKHLPIKDLLKNVGGKKEIFDKMIVRKPNDKDWFNGGLYHDDMDFGVPSFWFVSWYDVATSPNIALFNHVRNNSSDSFVRDNQYLIIAPTLHCGFTRATENTIVGERNLGDARLNYDEQIYDWFDMILKDIKNDFKEKTPKVQYYTMGVNKWQSSEFWPPLNTEMTTFYLSSNGNANTLNGDGKLTTNERLIEKVVTHISKVKSRFVGSTQVAGYVERLEIVGLGPFRAKFDTGNGTKASMFHVDKLEIKGKMAKWERGGKKFTNNIVGVSKPMHVDQIDKRPIVLVDIKFNNKLYKDVPIGLTTRDSKSTFLINRELLTRLKVAVNPDRKFVLSSYIERGDNNDEDYRDPR